MEIKMKKLFKAIRNLLKTGSLDGMTPTERYLAASTDLVELERRQRSIINGNLKGWV